MVALLATGTAMGITAPVAGASSSSGGTYHAVATFTGPVTTGHVIEPETALPSDLAAHDYVEQEFFATGTAHAFSATSAPADGKWTITPTTSAAYDTRVLVRRPANPAHFSGTVVVEWMNVSAGESAPDWDYLNPVLMEAGDAYIGVSAQALGVQGGTPILGGGVRHGIGPRAAGARPLRDSPPPRRPVRPRHLRPDRPRRPVLRPPACWDR